MSVARNSLWISANAGSGKTSTLTERVVCLLLEGVMPERIVCITYTKAAAGEMRHRVLSLLQQLLLAAPEVMEARAARILGRTPSAVELGRARHLYGQVLDSTSGGIQLTTIHGFCQDILRRFPMEAGLAPHFTLLEGSAEERMLATAKHRLQHMGEDAESELAAAFACVGERSSEHRFGDVMDDIIKKRVAWERLWRQADVNLMRTRIWAAHGLSADDTHASICDALCSLPNAENSGDICAGLGELLGHKNKGEQTLGTTLAAWLEAPLEHRGALLPGLRKAFLTNEGTLRARLVNDKEFPKGTPLRDALDRLAAAVFDSEQRVSALSCAEESLAVATIARELLEQYRHVKEAAQAIDFEDIIARTGELLADPTMLGWVMSKLDHRIDHILLDEAQDTSATQWQLAYTLAEELIASNGGIGSDGLPRSLLVVGDEKQSIYSFQGAEPQLFARNRERFCALLKDSQAPLTFDTRARSYRSAEAIINLVNTVTTMPDVAAALSTGERIPHEVHHQHYAGLIQCYALVQGQEREKPTPLIIPQEYAMQASSARLLAEHIAATIRTWLDNGRTIASLGRPVVPGDILILLRTRGPVFLALLRALQRLKIPVAGLDRLTLSENLAVRDLLALMAWCDNRADDMALAQVLRSPLIGMTEDGLREAAFGRDGPLHARTALPQLDRWFGLRHATPYDFLTEVLEVSGTRQEFARRFGAEIHEVLDELKSQAASMPAGMALTLSNFHDWMARSAREIKREQDAGDVPHVRIMTVHGAKGLESPIVVLPDTTSVPDTSREIAFFHEAPDRPAVPLLAFTEPAKMAPLLQQVKESRKASILAEYQRLLYVAITRPRHELHVFGSIGKNKMNEQCWYETISKALRSRGAEDADGVLTLRDARPAVPAAPKVASISPAPLPAWAREPAPDRVSAEAVLSPSQMTVAIVSPYVASAGKDVRERGVRIHRVLELLDAASDAAAIRRLVRHVAPDWIDDECMAVTKEISALHREYHWLWEHARLPEAGIMGTLMVDGRPRAVNGQVDLMVHTPDATIILDYKTARHMPASPADVSLTYLLQLAAYRDLVREIYPGKPVRCAILWTHGPRLMWLDEAVEYAASANHNVMLKTPLAS